MLTELHIVNFALVDELRLDLSRGFSVLTGETGAGKSIVVDALNAALGERTGSEVVRTGTEKCLVEAVFDVSEHAEAAIAASEYGFEPEDGLLIISREITRSGRSQGRINNRPTTASVLREITKLLVDIHGQHEHQSLLSVPVHVNIFDSWCGSEVMKLREEVQNTYEELIAVRSERNRIQTDERERARLLDLYKFQLDEIKSANLLPGEEEELAQERSRLANAEKLFEAASEIATLLGAESGAVDGLSAAVATAEKIAQMDPSMSEIVETLSTALISTQDVLLEVRDYQDRIEANPARLEQIEDRLEVIKNLKRKYGGTVEEILSYADSLVDKIDALMCSEERSNELDCKIEELTVRLASLSQQLSSLRKKAAPDFEKAVEAELADLAMERTRFEVSMQPIEPGPNGADAVEFLISPNPGEPVKPLAKIASGGEISRIMLALKSVAKRAEVPTLVFDEIDTGIGGRTAQVLGEKLASLANKCQIICVTHLPQIASRATHHFLVEKVVESGRSHVRVKKLEGEERVKELARMLGAEEGSDIAAEHAREMLSLANQGNGQAR
jgi:DNA repair protein RecN (Recombination protein N)